MWENNLNVLDIKSEYSESEKMYVKKSFNAQPIIQWYHISSHEGDDSNKQIDKIDQQNHHTANDIFR